MNLREPVIKAFKRFIYVEVIEYPLAYAETKADVDAYRFPYPDSPGRFRDMMIEKSKPTENRNEVNGRLQPAQSTQPIN